MPLTPFQREVLQLLAHFRSPDSYVAGGTVVNQLPDTPRFSDDVDIFHDAEDAVVRCAELDAGALARHGFTLSWMLQRPGFHRAIATRDDQSVRLDWAIDSAFRFFPVEPDPDLGFRLHRADVATNKALALAGRSEARDLVDILHLHETYLSLGAICWAASAKDPGFTPDLLLEEMGRNAGFRPEEFEPLALAVPFDLTAAKRKWLRALAEARELCAQLPPADVGCLYLDGAGQPVTPAGREQITPLRLHRATLRGTWPTVC